MVIQSTRQGNSIFDEMKSRAFNLHMMERQSAYEAYSSDDELADALEVSEDAYNFSLSKLDSLIVLEVRSAVVKCNFIKTKLYIEALDVSEQQKIDAILTAACIFKNFGEGLIKRNVSEEEFYLLSEAMAYVEPDDYSAYESLVLGDDFNKLVKLLKNFDDSTIERAKQYIKTENN